MKASLDLIGVGIGPFNLSLAALLEKTGVRSQFFDNKTEFSWHREIMFNDSIMQTSFLKDLVTPIDPTNPHSFLNFLVQKGLFYAHMNTSRGHVSRREFELYCQWVCQNLASRAQFSTPVDAIEFADGAFHCKVGVETHSSQHLSVATGHAPWTPDFAQEHLGETCFHAKSAALLTTSLAGKRVAIVGGGQTGLEVFRHCYSGKAGNVAAVTLLSRRHSLEPLDESPFTNEYFTPGYVREFFEISDERKRPIVEHQRLASDGNTPSYLQEVYNDLYQLKHVHGQGENVHILPQRQVVGMTKTPQGATLTIENCFNGAQEEITADIVILCTGFKTVFPACLDSLKTQIEFFADGRPRTNAHFALQWEQGARNKIYLMNHGRYIHGIAEPQTSLMAWRSATIINDLMDQKFYPSVDSVANFATHGTRKL